MEINETPVVDIFFTDRMSKKTLSTCLKAYQSLALLVDEDRAHKKLKAQANRAMCTHSRVMAIVEAEKNYHKLNSSAEQFEISPDVVFSHRNTYAEDMIPEHEEIQENQSDFAAFKRSSNATPPKTPPQTSSTHESSQNANVNEDESKKKEYEAFDEMLQRSKKLRERRAKEAQQSATGGAYFQASSEARKSSNVDKSDKKTATMKCFRPTHSRCFIMSLSNFLLVPKKRTMTKIPDVGYHGLVQDTLMKKRDDANRKEHPINEADKA